jgi:membrane protein implicated in regulation of membrane protease activity
MVVILIILLLAAVFGVLGAVLKFTAILLFTLMLTFLIVAVVGWWAFRRWTRKVGKHYEAQTEEYRVTKYRENESDPGELPPTRDDRY